MWLVREKERDEELRQRAETEQRGRDIPPPLREQYKITIWNRLLHSKILRGIMIVVAVAIFVPVLLFIFLNMDPKDLEGKHTCHNPVDFRIPCGLPNITEDDCWDNNCCYDIWIKSCYHYLPSKYLYKAEGDSEEIFYLTQTLQKTPFGEKSKPKMYLTITPETKNKVSISLHEQPAKKVIRRVYANTENNYEVTVYKEETGVKVKRISTGKVLLSTSRGPTIVSDRYWEWTVDLESEHLFGIDFLRAKENQTITRIIYKNAEDHTSVPKFMAFQNGSFHGLEIDHSGPLEVTVLPSRLILLRSLAGDYLTLHLSIGPSPVDVLNQQRKVDFKLTPYWALGVHICRDGNFSTIADVLKEFYKIGIEKLEIPYDSDCIHENIFSIPMNGTEEEIKDIKQAVSTLEIRKKRFIMSLAPQIVMKNSVYQEAEKLGILYDKQGKYLRSNVSYPDYSLDTDDQKLWFKKNFDGLGVKADGFVLRNNWPVNENYTENATDKFQYMTESIRKTFSYTLPWNSKIGNTEHILRHNSYGFEYAKAISQLIKPDDLLLSAAFTTDTPAFAHEQNVNISWVNFKEMITKTLSHSLFGGPFYSTPICGSTRFYKEETHQSVCSRWYLAAATMPLFRISSEKPRRDPYSFNSLTMKNVAYEAIKIRYTLLPYYYTVLSENMPLVRPMFFNYPKDNETFYLDEQYMVGDGLLVAQPVLYQIPIIKLYLPENEGGWFEFWGGKKYPLKQEWIEIPLVETDLIAFVAAGSIVPLQNTIASTAEQSRLEPLKLAIALNCLNNTAECKASGKLYVPNSGYLLFNANGNSLQVSHNVPESVPLSVPLTIAFLKVYGLPYHNETALDIRCVMNGGPCKIDGSKQTIQYKEPR